MYIHSFRFCFTSHLLEVDVFINVVLMCWIYFYALSYFPSHGHVPIQTFQPFLASGLNEQVSPTEILPNGIPSTWPSIACQLVYSILWLGCTPFPQQRFGEFEYLSQCICLWYSSLRLNTYGTTLFFLGLWVNLISIRAKVSCQWNSLAMALGWVSKYLKNTLFVKTLVSWEPK